jgi:GntR family transcriptional regulator, transcriptional repressor for pyruvate dehydrogenase complex
LNLENPFTPVRPTRASTDVAAQVRRAILSGRYQSGDRLPTERELARQFGVSRVTIRDALRALEASGLVRVRMGGQGGPYVAHPDVALLSENLGNHMQLSGCTFEELAEARLALETTAARLAAERAQPEDLEAIKAAIVKPAGAAAAAAASLDFHQALVRAAHNQALWIMFMAMRSLIQEAFGELHASQPDMAKAARTDHTALYNAITRGEGELAVKLMREHLYDFVRRAARRASRVSVTSRRETRAT